MADILLLEDSKLMRLQIKNALEKDNHNIIILDSASQLRNAISGSNKENLKEIDLILQALPFAGRRNLDFIKTIKESYPEKPLVIVSSLASRNVIMAAMNCGADDYLLKPFSIPDLKKRINSLLPEGKTEKSDAIFKNNITKFRTSLALEVNRATRGNSAFTAARFETEREIKFERINKIKELITKNIRMIDQVFVISEDSFVLILPLTDSEDFNALLRRLRKDSENFGEFEKIMNIKSITFPDQLMSKINYNNVDKNTRLIEEKMGLND